MIKVTNYVLFFISMVTPEMGFPENFSVTRPIKTEVASVVMYFFTRTQKNDRVITFIDLSDFIFIQSLQNQHLQWMNLIFLFWKI